jgi:hypothetical protein
MKNLFKKGWFQVVLFGAVIGAVLILLDSRYHWFSSKKEESNVYNGPVTGDKGKMYFTTAEYSEVKYDFGKAREGDTIKHVFKLKNTGKEPLFIFKAVGSCECIWPVFSSDPLPPGKEQEITVVFATLGRKGKQVRSIYIDTNTDPAEMVLTVSGEVE